MNHYKEQLCNLQKPSLFFEELKEKNLCIQELEDLIGVPQNPKHHPEGDVWTHTMMVLDQASELKHDTLNPYGFMLLALCHDLGKPATTTIENGLIRSIGHERRTDIVQKALAQITDDTDVIDYVVHLTKLHMRANALYYQKSSQKAYNKLFNECKYPIDLILFSKADHLGRLNAPDYTEIEQYLMERYNEYKKI